MKKSILLPLTIHLKPHNKRWPDLLPPNQRNWLCMGILLAAIEIAALATVLDTLLISLTSQQQDQITLWWNGFFFCPLTPFSYKLCLGFKFCVVIADTIPYVTRMIQIFLRLFSLVGNIWYYFNHQDMKAQEK